MLVPYVVNRVHGGERQADIYSAMLEERTIFINGEINDETATSVVAELLFLEALDPEKPINVYINSPGGLVTSGLAIYDTMRHVRCKVHTLCCGQACSMAAVLLAAGDERSCLPSARVMIHQPSGGAQGKQSDIVITAKEITKLRNMLAEMLVKHTNQSLEKIESDIERDFYMSAEEAVAYGLADNIVMPTAKNIMEEK